MSIRKILLLLCFAGLQTLNAQNKRLISGNVIDVTTKEPLAYVTVSLKKELIGVVTNEEGKFDLYVPQEVQNDTLFVNYLGYKHFLSSLSEVQTPITISLEQTVVQLDEIVIRPMPPEHYILMAMRKIKENYPDKAFEADAYYREKMLENNVLISSKEGFFKTYCLSFLDTVKTQNQLQLYRKISHTDKMVFLHRMRERQHVRDSLQKIAKRDSLEKAGKKPEATVAVAKKDSTVKDSVMLDLGSTFGGPENVLRSGPIGRKPEAFLDSNQFKSYTYTFAKSTSYNTNELMVIDFKSKGKVNNVREGGKIYLDPNSLAIVKLEWNGAFVMPGFIKPIFFILGLRMKNPTYDKHMEFQLVEGRWYPKNIQFWLSLNITDKHMFRKDDHSLFDIEQFFTVNALKTNNVSEIALAKRFDPNKNMEKQVFNEDSVSWKGLNIIKPEDTKK